ncbi:hypothetical protein INT43_003510 [Umbelopsis isabellina]|uniref:Uncharacterized protein n=1 Tax=Mortierella isabellina TaxID=91625 RepID=A0A8H7PQ69_MORIS|nr:hypothetical protein INT43_003510 [Umbelopsis isabellina]
MDAGILVKGKAGGVKGDRGQERHMNMEAKQSSRVLMWLYKINIFIRLRATGYQLNPSYDDEVDVAGDDVEDA